MMLFGELKNGGTINIGVADSKIDIKVTVHEQSETTGV
jgi:hypothetical protein